MVRRIVVLISAFVVLGLGGALLHDTSTLAEEAGEDMVGLMLTCSGPGGFKAMKAIRELFGKHGYEVAYTLADEYVRSGDCEYSARETYRSTVKEVACKVLKNGHCLAIQPVRERQTGWTGYMLFLSNPPSGDVREPVEFAEIGRPGLYVNSLEF